MIWGGFDHVLNWGDCLSTDIDDVFSRCDLIGETMLAAILGCYWQDVRRLREAGLIECHWIDCQPYFDRQQEEAYLKRPHPETLET